VSEPKIPLCSEPDKERELRICRDQGRLREAMEAYPTYVSAAERQRYYDVNFLLEQLRKAQELSPGRKD